MSNEDFLRYCWLFENRVALNRTDRQITDISDYRNQNRSTFLESDCLLGQLKRMFEISDSEASPKVEKSGGVDWEGMCGDVVEKAVRERRSLDISEETCRSPFQNFVIVE